MLSEQIEFTKIFDAFVIHSNSLKAIPEAYHPYLSFLPLFFLALIISLLLTPIIGHLADKYAIGYKPKDVRKGKSYDNPDKHVEQNFPQGKSVPGLGGMAVTIPLFFILLLLFELNPIYILFAVALGILIVASFLDDVYNLSGAQQFLLQFIAAALIAFSTINLTYLNNPFGGIIDLNWKTIAFSLGSLRLELAVFGDLIIIAWVMIAINAVKWVGGSPGLIEANSFIAFLLIFVLSIRTGSSDVAALSIFAAGAILGLLYFAFPPQKIFSMSSGKTTYGFLIAALSIMNGSKLATTIIIIMIPLVDFVFVIIKRYIEHRPKNPLHLLKINDTNHLHHQLIKMKFTPRQILLIETSGTLAIGAIAVLTTGALKFFLLIILGICVLLTILVLHIMVRRRQAQEPPKPPKVIKKETPESKYTY